MSEFGGGLAEDDALLLELADALHAVTPHAHDVAVAGKAAFIWRTLDADLLMAQLSFDSLQSSEPVTTRNDPQTNRVLVFSADLRTVEIEVLTDRIVGQFIPPSAGAVEVEGEDGVVSVAEVDELGFFVIEPVPKGVVRLRCTTATTRLVTEWFHL